MCQQRIYQSAAVMTRCGVYHDSSRFVDDDDVPVFEHYIKLYALSCWSSGFGDWKYDIDSLQRFQFQSRVIDKLVLDFHLALGNKALKAGPADVGEAARQKPIEAFHLISSGRKMLRS